MSLRYVLAPVHLHDGVFGWQLTRAGRYLDCHENFDVNIDRDIEAAADWAERIIGTRQDWRHTRVGGPDRWIAAPQGDIRTAFGTDVLRALEPGTLVVPVGPGGAGKSTFAAEAEFRTVISLDVLREQIGGDAGDQSLTPAAVIEQNILLERHLGEGNTVYLDSTNVEPRVRADLVERAQRHGRPIVALRILPPLATCRARNRARPANRRVPDEMLNDVLAWQHSLACAATPHALIAEGFTAAHDIVTPL